MTEERDALIAAVREFAGTELAPNAARWDAEKHFPIDTLQRAGDLGLGGVYVREEFGGSGLSRLDAVAMFEELAKGDRTPKTLPINGKGDGGMKEEWVRAIREGKPEIAYSNFDMVISPG